MARFELYADINNRVPVWVGGNFLIDKVGGKNLDKNLKAELVALRNEVLTNLKNIENVVGKIDHKLQDEDEIACLLRCPKLDALLQQCKTVKWHPDTVSWKIDTFLRTVKDVEDLMSVSTADRYTDAMVKIIDFSKRLDQKMGGIPGRSPSDEYWDSIEPGHNDRAVEQLYETKIKEGDIKPPAVAVDDADVKNALDRMNRRLGQREPIYTSDLPTDADVSLAPEWARHVDHKSSTQILKEAAEWDDDSQTLFGRMWNQNARRRIDIMEEVMAEAITHVQSYNYYNERITIKNQDEAKSLVARYQALETAKACVIEVLKNFDRATIQEMLASIAAHVADPDNNRENLENWVIYYKWNLRLAQELENIARSMPQGAEVALSCMSMLKVISADKEMTMHDPMVIDMATFEPVPMKMPADKLDAFRRKAHADYMRDLKRAYAWLDRVNQDTYEG